MIFAFFLVQQSTFPLAKVIFRFVYGFTNIKAKSFKNDQYIFKFTSYDWIF